MTTITDELGGAPPPGASPTDSVAVIDFRRPTPMLPEQSTIVRDVQDELMERLSPMLSSRLRTPCRLTVSGMEMMSRDDMIAASEDSSVAAVCALHPLHGAMVVRLPLQLADMMVDLVLGGTGRPGAEPHPLGEIEAKVLHRLLDHWIPAVVFAWRPLAALRPEMTGIATTQRLAQFSAADPLLRVTAEVELGEHRSAIDLWVPNAVLTTVLRGVESSEPATSASAGTTAFREVIADVLRKVDVELTVDFATVRMASSTLLALRPGDVIPLQAVDEPLVLRAGDVPVGTVRPARHGTRTACQITSILHPLPNPRREHAR